MSRTGSGWSGPKNHSDVEWEEHGKQGDVETGRAFKGVQEIPMTERFDVVDSNLIYLGESKPGTTTDLPLWRISKVVISGPSISITYPDGSDLFEYSWDDHLTLTYS